MIGATVVVCVTLLVLWWRVEPVVRAWDARRAARAAVVDRAIEDLSMALVGRLVPRPSAPRVVDGVATELPSDLRSYAMRESEDWAREAVEKEMQQLYAQATGTPEARWNHVRKMYEMATSDPA